MKKLFTLLLAFSFATGIFSQAPEKMSYQAVLRGVSNELITDQAVGMQISILQGSASGTAVYVETQTPTTNASGLVSIEIGTGTVVSGDFATIGWSNGPYFIKTETDPDGGSTYTITGTSQLLSVPYAMYSKTAENVIGGVVDVAEVMIYGTPVINSDGSWVGPAIDETDPSVPSGTQTGEMQYWDGTAWITVAVGNEGQVLTLTGGVPTWVSIAAHQLSSTEVYNPTTGKIWMDRNLGATQVATSSTDAASYGDLYQWGRAADGHESRTSGTTSTLSSTDNPGHGDFILAPDSPYDWRSPQNDNLWQGLSGTNNPCPDGYRLPTQAEWEAERASWGSYNTAGAFGSPLKLPVAGNRSFSNGSLSFVGSYGGFWSSTVDGTSSWLLFFDSSSARMSSVCRAVGLSVRCLKD